jgi:hypothetical protein
MRPWTAATVRARELFPSARLRACGADGIAMHRGLARLGLQPRAELAAPGPGGR